MPGDKTTYGFNARDADSLINIIESPARVFSEWQPIPANIRLYRFTLNEAWASNAADADILEMDGTDTTIDADVQDPLGIFSDLTTGDAGICIFQGGSYYAIQAPCAS